MGREFGIEQIQALMKSVAEHKIGELCFECEGLKLKIKGQCAAPQISPQLPAQAAAIAVTADSAAAAAVGTVSVESHAKATYLTSPIVGTFYAASAPDKKPFASLGCRIAKGCTAFIVESMKVMNEVPAELDGTVAEILVKDGEAVEYGQPVIRLE